MSVISRKEVLNNIKKKLNYTSDFELLNTIMLCEEKIKSAGMSVEIGELTDVDISSDKIKHQCTLTNVIFNAADTAKVLFILCRRRIYKFLP